jgi:hypothetical protein
LSLSSQYVIREKIENELRVIKKHGSRRLYDTKDSCYVAFLELGIIIADGKEFRIFDAKTNLHFQPESSAQHVLLFATPTPILSVYPTNKLIAQLPIVNWINLRPTKVDLYAGQAGS